MRTPEERAHRRRATHCIRRYWWSQGRPLGRDLAIHWDDAGGIHTMDADLHRREEGARHG